MYEILIKSDFCGAHNLRGYQGKCEGLHGHNWKIEARFEGKTLDNIGMAIDFKILKSGLKDILDKLDHKHLNELDVFKKENPSAENIARFIYEGLKAFFGKKDVAVKSVSVWESDTSCATYYE
ncbi:MAG: 6-carboxytetrahydropterin synthase QueD [Candidatus Omnitrophica bacterium]|nr:6-carboxytetrahydropterin synthase QueD [Candidatus Omnitrophota bacterium]